MIRSSGGVIYPIVFARLEQTVNFGWAIRILAFILLGTSALPIIFMRSRTSPRTERKLIDWSAFRDLPYLLLNLGLFFGFMGLYIVFYYIELFAINRIGVSKNLATYLLIIINVSSLPGRIVPGYYADKVGSINMQTIVVSISVILTFLLLAIRTTAGILVFSALYGISSGAFMALPAAGIVSLSTDKALIGTRIGMTLAFVGFGVLVSNPIAGAILGQEEDWVGLIGWCGGLLVASTFSMAASRVSKVGFGLTNVI